MANITYIRVDDEVYALHDDNALTSDSNLDASKVVGTLPANTYTNTTYESKAAVQGGTDVSLVTTGDKYRWNNASSGGVSDVEVNGSSVVSGGIAEITVPTKTSDLTNDSNFQNATQVDTAINTRIASVYKAKGSVAFLDLPALTSSNEGFVYDINESFTTTSDFVEGAGKTYPAGTNVVIIDTGSGVYKYDVLAGLVDLSGKQDLLVSGTNIKTINGNSVLGSGNLTVSGGLQNLVDGSASGSVRGIDTGTESSQYRMGEDAFAEGYITKASGPASHAEGYGTTASGDYSHAEGLATTASGVCAHAEGNSTVASGSKAHAEGGSAVASGLNSHAQNFGTIAAKDYQTAIGKYNIEDTETTKASQKALIIGNGSENNRSNALTVDWNGNVDIASGASYKINGTALSASDVGAQPTLVSGTNIKTINNQSVLGSGNISIPTGLQNLVDGSLTGSVRGIGATVEDSSYTMGLYAVAEGANTKASGNSSHAEGATTIASGGSSHAEGLYTTASGGSSHAQNVGTIAAKKAQTAIGTYNIEDTSTTTTHPSGTVDYGANAFIIGNGTSTSNRSNAFAVSWNGTVTNYNSGFERGVGGTNNDGVTFADKNGDSIAYMKALFELDSQDRTIEGFNVGTTRTVNDSTTWNTLRLMIDADGNPIVTISRPEAWREELNTPSIIADTFSKDNISISKESIVTGQTINVAKSGYTPIAIVNHYLDNASTSGANCSMCVTYLIKLSGTTVTAAIRNYGSAAAKVRQYVTVLYKEDFS